MINRNDFKSILRQLYKNKIYFFINTLSLSVGLICCLFAFAYIKDEFSFDQFHEDAEQIYRLEYEIVSEDGQKNSFANLHGNVLPTGLNTIPEIELNTRFALHADLNIEVLGTQFGEDEVLAADENFFTLFTFDFLYGEPESSLKAPRSVVIDESTAVKYFGEIDKVLGKSLTIRFQGKEESLVINGIIKDVPSNSHFDFNLVTSSHIFKNLYGFSIEEVQMGYNYVRLTNNVGPEQVQAKINALKKTTEPSFDFSYKLEKLTSIHLFSSDRAELSANGDIKYLFLLSSITFLIIVISSINFTTLTTARSIKRATEIGVRKVYGAMRMNLIGTFLVEGILFSLFALIVSYIFFWEFLSYINSISAKGFTFFELISPATIIPMVILAIVIGSITVLYPALFLTGNKPSSLLLKHASLGFRSNKLWRSVIIIQFTATLVLISVGYIIHQQIDFIQNKELGFYKEQIITFPNYFGTNSESFLKELERHPNIKSTTVSSYIPGVSKNSGTALVKTENKQEGITFDWISIDPNYLSTYEIKLIKGRNFSTDRSTDSTQAFIINETAAQTLGWNEPLGKNLEAFGTNGYVVGIVEDFNFLSLHNKISPLIMLVHEDLYFSISARFESEEQIPETISYISKTWSDMLPGALFSYNFVDHKFNEVYKSERRTQTLFLIFSGLAVLISVLGLFSFASYSVHQKQKEIGIRKVLGASIQNLLIQFYSGYFKFLLVSSIIAFPLVYLWSKKWLQDFHFKAELGITTLLLPILVVILAIFTSVSYQVIKGALANPVDSIKSE